MRGLSSILGIRSSDRQKPAAMSPPDLTLLFSGDVTEWDHYLARHFEDFIVHHEQVENTVFPIPSCQTTLFSETRVVLVILSPQFLAFLESHPEEFFQLSKLLKPGKTLAMLCGVRPNDVKYFHKAALVSYDDWRHLVISTDKDVNMVRSVIETVQEMLSRSKENERRNKPRFKLVPRKVQEGNGKIHVMLTKPVDMNAKVRVCLGVGGMKEVPVEKRNPYTLMFVIPDDCMNLMSLLNIHIWCGEDLLGVSQIKCESKMSELFSLLTDVDSPYEFLCNTLGMATLHDVDEYLTTAFRKNLPVTGFNLLHPESNYQREKSKEEFPTLLHFASRYGLCQLVKELLKCPGAELAYLLKNVRMLTPAQLANLSGHNDVAAIIDEYQISFYSLNKGHCESPDVDSNFEQETINPDEFYDIPSHPVPISPAPVVVIDDLIMENENEYMKMQSHQKENIEPFHQKLLNMQEKRDSLNEIVPLTDSSKSLVNENFQPEKSKLTLLESQAKLIEIMEAYKKGASLTEVERLHNEWKALYQVTDIEAKSTLDGLRNLYAKAQKAKLSKKHSTSFSELRQFFNSKLRRKDSIGSKASLSRKNSKDMLSMEKLNVESDANRPISTLSVLSTTSSSSGSSFDRLSTASAGSDSGHHSDISEDHSFKKKDKFDSKYSNEPVPCWLTNSSSPKNIPSGMFSGKPPAPPPRPTKLLSRYATINRSSEIPQYAVSRKSATLPNSDILNEVEYIQPDSNNYNGGESSLKATVSKKDLSFLDDPNDNYDCPPPPRPSCLPNSPPSSYEKNSFRQRSFSGSSFHDPQIDYDLVPPPRPSCCPDSKSNTYNNKLSGQKNLSTSSRNFKLNYDHVPPPLPLSSPPIKINDNFSDTYDVLNPSIPRRIRSNSVSSNYDFPRIPVPTDLTNAHTCLSAFNSSSHQSKLPSVPSFDILPDTKKDAQNILKQYHNLCYKSPKDDQYDQRDSIPEEMAPPPPVDVDLPDEHYKIVGLPIPVSPPFVK